jgi:hypothetical protein
MTAFIAVPAVPPGLAGLAARDVRRTPTFPFVSLPAGPGRVPVEVTLVARLGHGEGDRLFFEALARQRQHARFVDELDEPSAKLCATDLGTGDATALYSFAVGRDGHPFHRHAGHRVFTAVSGSGGTQLCFSSVAPDELARDPASFVRALHHVNVPPDCLFTVRFSGETWHRFVPLRPRSGHPALFALSTHTNELGGDLGEATRDRVLRDEADIPSLTELLPPTVARWLAESPPRLGEAATTELSLHDRPGSLLQAACARFRSMAGHLHRWRLGCGLRPAFVSVTRANRVVERPALAEDCLLLEALRDRVVHHEDAFSLGVRPAPSDRRDAAAWLAAALDGFMANSPAPVARMMALRNVLVRPLGLRTSPLGCPVSSLLAPRATTWFDGRFPVHAQRVSADGRTAQVLLGADDKHLVFRSCVGVRLKDDDTVEFSLSDRVACRNLFGRVYMALITGTHRRVVAPTMLTHAVDWAMASTATTGAVPRP